MIKFFKKKNQRGTRRSNMRKRPSKRIDFFFLWMRRFGIVIGGVVLTLWIGAWLWLSGSIQSAGDWSRHQAIEISADAGFTVQNIMVEGRVNTDPDVLLGLVNIRKDDPLFSFQPKTAKDLIERIAWVKSVKVERRLPDTIYIELEERQPLALYQQNKKLFLIDLEGKVITDFGLNRFQDLLLVSGAGAQESAHILVKNLAVEEILLPYIEAASYISRRRWNLKTRSGITVKLPAEDIGFALRRLALFQEDNQILDKDLEHIDLRDESRILVQAAPGKVQEYSINQFKAGYSPGDDI